jgi:hypothetical protein
MTAVLRSEIFVVVVVVVVCLRTVRQLLVTANLAPSSPILFTPMMEALLSPETSVLTRDTA